MVASPLSPSGFLKSENGQVYYAYSGIKTLGGTSEVIMHIPNTGLDDLIIDMTATADWSSVAGDLGIAVTLNADDIFYQNEDVTAGIKTIEPWHFRFFCPSQSELVVTSYNDGASGAASRSCMLVATPIWSTIYGA